MRTRQPPDGMIYLQLFRSRWIYSKKVSIKIESGESHDLINTKVLKIIFICVFIYNLMY